jgi:hypothetical protein
LGFMVYVLELRVEVGHDAADATKILLMPTHTHTHTHTYLSHEDAEQDLEDDEKGCEGRRAHSHGGFIAVRGRDEGIHCRPYARPQQQVVEAFVALLDVVKGQLIVVDT